MLSAELKPLKGREPRKGPPPPHVANGPSSHTANSELATAQGQGLARLLFASRVQQGYEVQVQVISVAIDHATYTRHSCWVTSARMSRGINRSDQQALDRRRAADSTSLSDAIA